MRAMLFAGLILFLAGSVKADEPILEWAPIELPGARQQTPINAPDHSQRSPYETVDEYSKGFSLNITKRPRKEVLRQKQQELKKLQQEIADLPFEIHWQQKLLITVRCFEVEHGKTHLEPQFPLTTMKSWEDARRWGRRTSNQVLDSKSLKEFERFLDRSGASVLLDERQVVECGKAAAFTVGVMSATTDGAPVLLRRRQANASRMNQNAADLPSGFSLRIKPKNVILDEIQLHFATTTNIDGSNVQSGDWRRDAMGAYGGLSGLTSPAGLNTEQALLISGIATGDSETQLIWLVTSQRTLQQSDDLDSIRAEVMLERSFE